METIPIIELNHTDPVKRGQAYGEAGRDRIQTILSIYREIFQRTTGETWEETVARGNSFHARAHAFAPDLMQELNGIAEGANRVFEEIFLLNARSEILFNPEVLANECTSLVALPECTANGDTAACPELGLVPGSAQLPGNT